MPVHKLQRKRCSNSNKGKNSSSVFQDIITGIKICYAYASMLDVSDSPDTLYQNSISPCFRDSARGMCLRMKTMFLNQMMTQCHHLISKIYPRKRNTSVKKIMKYCSKIFNATSPGSIIFHYDKNGTKLSSTNCLSIELILIFPDDIWFGCKNGESKVMIWRCFRKKLKTWKLIIIYLGWFCVQHK